MFFSAKTTQITANRGIKSRVLCLILVCVLLALIPLSACSDTGKNPENIGQEKLNDDRFSYMLASNTKTYMLIGRGQAFEENITVPDTAYGILITSIGENAFQEDKTLISIKMTDRIISFGDYSFYLCENLESVNMPKELQDVGVSAFLGCVKITEVHLPDTLKYVRSKAFYGCTSLSQITYDGTVDDWKRVSVADNAFDGVMASEIICKDGTIPLK